MEATVETRKVIRKVFKLLPPSACRPAPKKASPLPASTRPTDLDFVGEVSVTLDPLDITLFVNGLSVFVGYQVAPQVDWLAAEYAAHFCERATHKCLLVPKTSQDAA
jgi:hypothetical protein